MGKLFVSYSRRDTETVDQIVDRLTKAGLDVWIDRQDIEAGRQWRTEIVEAIDTCDAFVLMLSPHSAASENVRKEVDLSQESDRKLFPVLLAAVRPPADLRYQLAGIQMVDLSALGVDEACKRLIKVVKDHQAKLAASRAPANRQAELVIQGVNLADFGEEKQQELLAFVARLTGAERGSLQLAGLAAGSVHVFIKMPRRAAYALKALALNSDRRFASLGVTALRLDGDPRFVHIPTGALTTAATLSPLRSLWMKVPAVLPKLFGAVVGKALFLILTAVLAGALIAGGVSLSGGGVPATPTPTVKLLHSATPTHRATVTPTPRLTHTPSLTPTPTQAGGPTIFIKVTGDTKDLESCTQYFALQAADPDGIKYVEIRFHVGWNPTEKDFETPDAVFELRPVSGQDDLWERGIINTFSVIDVATYWRIYVTDGLGNVTVYTDIPTENSFFPRNIDCTKPQLTTTP